MKKIILFIAIALHIVTFFMDMVYVYNDGIINGFFIIGDNDKNLYPIPGILSTIWIGINMFFLLKKEFRMKAAYIIMNVISSLFFLLFTGIIMAAHSFEQEGAFLQSGMYVLVATFFVYTVAYLLMSKKGTDYV